MLDLPSFPYRSRSEVHADFWNSTPTGTLTRVPQLRVDIGSAWG